MESPENDLPDPLEFVVSSVGSGALGGPPIAGASIEFETVSGLRGFSTAQAAALSSRVTVVTDSAGVARVGVVLGPSLGTQTLSARTSRLGFPLMISITADPGPFAGEFPSITRVPLGVSRLADPVVFHSSRDTQADGRADLLLADSNGSFVRLLLSEPGRSVTVVPLQLGAAALSRAVIVDMDGDGLEDLVTTTASTVTVRFAASANAWDAPSATSVVLSTGMADTLQLAVGDLDSDGRMDLAVCRDNVVTSTPPHVAVFRNLGSRAFSGSQQAGLPTTVGANLRSGGVAVGDLDGDGRAEVVIANFNALNPTVSIFRLDSSGLSHVVTRDLSLEDGGPALPRVLDLDRNGRNEIVVARGRSFEVIFSPLSTDTHSRRVPVAPAFGFGPGSTTIYGVVLEDANGDGSPDLLYTRTEREFVYLRLGDGQGGFGRASLFALPRLGGAATLADFDGDRRMDLAVYDGRGGVEYRYRR